MEVVDNFKFVQDGTLLSRLEYPAAAMGLYLLLIWGLSTRKGNAIDTKHVDIVHNALLVVISAVTAVGVASGALIRSSEDGWYGLVCSARAPEAMWDGRIGYWSYVFYLTKYYELFDTIMLTLKKKTLLPLHVYHHMIMPLVGWTWFAFPWLEGAWYCAFINSLVHVAMYSYYFLATLKIRVWWKKYLTACQIVQFISGTVFVVTFYYLKFTREEPCSGNGLSALFSVAVNLSFLALFSLFYAQNYRKPSYSRIDLTAKQK
ncbi:hypothetical protein NDN08_003122 [Rhodosorus marinus]|uniref:Elongation of fatty acids protein n=1 Tax=Rhodosorus marinus TaxID=101924 RepID=A0AAV8UVS9_9RHOD|nr:hypothetical protein NDN08_003122 [Rhodosorus marinus]